MCGLLKDKLEQEQTIINSRVVGQRHSYSAQTGNGIAHLFTAKTIQCRAEYPDPLQAIFDTETDFSCPARFATYPYSTRRITTFSHR